MSISYRPQRAKRTTDSDCLNFQRHPHPLSKHQSTDFELSVLIPFFSCQIIRYRKRKRELDIIITCCVLLSQLPVSLYNVKSPHLRIFDVASPAYDDDILILCGCGRHNLYARHEMWVELLKQSATYFRWCIVWISFERHGIGRLFVLKSTTQLWVVGSARSTL